MVTTKGKLLYSSQDECFYYKSGELIVYKNNSIDNRPGISFFYSWPDVSPGIIFDGQYIVFWATNINTLICFRIGKFVWSWTDVHIKDSPRLNRCRSYIIVETDKELMCIQRGICKWKRRCSYVASYGNSALVIDRGNGKNNKLIAIDCTSNHQLWSVVLPVNNVHVIDGNVCYEQKGKIVMLSCKDGSRKAIFGKIRDGNIIPKKEMYRKKSK